MEGVNLYSNVDQMGWLVRHFEGYQFKTAAMADKFFPRPYVSLIFHFKDRAHISASPKIKLGQYFLAPIIPQAFILEFQGEIDTFVVTCKASVFSRLFQIDMSPHLKRSIDLDPSLFLPLWKQLAQLPSTEARLKYFSCFINALSAGPYTPDAVDVLYDKILEKNTSIPLKKIFQECAASKSTLLRKFVKRTGVSPKTLVRIVRLDMIWKKIVADQAVNYQELVFYGNYFDQSHFINDFSAIIGETPGSFFARNLEIVKLFSGIPNRNK